MTKHLILLAALLLLFCRKSEAQNITTIAGNGIAGVGGDGTPATAAQILQCYGLAFDSSGNLYIGTNGNPTFTETASKVRMVDPAGIISTFAGTDTVGFWGDGGPATAARFGFVNAIACDKKGNVYIADLNGNLRVRKVDASGIITTFAGNGSMTVSGDGGPATAAGLSSGAGICLDAVGNVYISAGNRIRKVDTAGIISTYAGNGSGIYSGDGGQATNAGMTANEEICIDANGNLYLVDGNRVRKINSSGIISTIAGTGVAGYSGDNGPATLAKLFGPTGVSVDKCGNLYIADDKNYRVRKVSGSGIITTFAGIGTIGYGGDNGPATAAKFYGPNYLCFDNIGSLYISDGVDARIRYVHMDSCINKTAEPVVTTQEDALRIWPNPAEAGQLTLLLSAITEEGVKVSVSDVTGSRLLQFATTTNKEMPLRLNVPPGMYFITAETAGGRWVKKLVVSR